MYIVDWHKEIERTTTKNLGKLGLEFNHSIFIGLSCLLLAGPSTGS